ncbi:MinD/ParA family protein [Ornithinibacillus bavariensis]|uniref:MinD/ParA family protein n=1 Tax=Ornithinibacillus bavariensis TaxID=545502 RepID=UPI001FD5B68F|nr:MinD/ParA family protein [Ornithinibacillus bavariensis]
MILLIHDQADSLRRQLKMMKTPKHAKTISFVSGKGGVGKSNIAVNFSLSLCKLGKKVLLIDLDIGMGNVEILLGLQAKKTIVEMLQVNLPITDIMESGPMNLSFIAGGSGLSNIFSMSGEKMDYFLQQYESIVHKFDYIIFDLGAGASQASIDFVLASDECIVITTSEPTSITDAYSMIKHLVASGKNIPIQMVLNRAESIKSGLRTVNRFQTVIERFLGIELKLLGILPEDKTVPSAVMKQAPFVLTNEKAPVAKAMKQLVNNYSQKELEIESVHPTSFVERLKNLLKNR